MLKLFGRIRPSENWSREINHHNNFRNFFMALQVLFRYAIFNVYQCTIYFIYQIMTKLVITDKRDEPGDERTMF